MLTDWQFVGIFFLLSPIFPAAPVIAQDSWIKFKVQYYIYALAFVVFDVEAIFLFPIAAAYGQIGLFGIGAAALFIFLLADGLVYAWDRGILEWV